MKRIVKFAVALLALWVCYLKFEDLHNMRKRRNSLQRRKGGLNPDVILRPNLDDSLDAIAVLDPMEAR